jgi:methionine sulfoxide reductase heme-binding subunit
LKLVVFVAALVPFAHLVWRGFNGDLTADPLVEITNDTGIWTLRFVVITLAITPIRRLTGWNPVIRVRRMLGLFAFFYAVVHFTVYLVLDLELDFGTLGEDIAKRPYITIGFLALVLLIPLAVTSTNKMMRRLGRRWTKLHRLVYVISILGVWHYYWQVKKDVREPLIYAGILAVLLGYRIYKQWRVTSKSAPATAPERT